jgi:hypothetical protein
MCLLALDGAIDFRTQNVISLHTLDDHHIFPKAYLDQLRPELKDPQKNVILNRTLIVDSTNRKIGKHAPVEYLQNEEIIEQATKGEILNKHFINAEAHQALINNDFDRFLNIRNGTILEKIRDLLTIS